MKADFVEFTENLYLNVSTGRASPIEIIHIEPEPKPDRSKAKMFGFLRTRSLEEMSGQKSSFLNRMGTVPIEKRLRTIGTQTDEQQEYDLIMQRAEKEWKNYLDTMTALKFEELRGAHHKQMEELLQEIRKERTFREE